MKIEAKKVISFHYTLKNEAGKILDSSMQGSPLEYLHGAGNIIPGLEKELLGLEPGAKKHVEVEPEQGYGVRREDLVVEMPRKNIQFEGEIAPGMQFFAETPDGQAFALTVVGIDDAAGTIKLDGNHPMAGVKLFFDVEILTVRDATEKELKEGRPEQHGCSCGCHHDHEDGDHECHCHGNGEGGDHECCCGGKGHGNDGECRHHKNK